VSPPPYYPQWRIQTPYHQWRYTSELLDGVHVHRCPVWLPRHPRGLGRVLYGLSFALASLPVMLREALRGPDLLLVTVPSFLNSVVAWAAARTAGSTAWLHIHDFEIDLAYDFGQFRRGRRVAELLESLILRRFDVVSSITRRMLNKVCAKGVPENRLYMLPNWFDPATIRPLPHASPMRSQFEIPNDSVVAMFSGSLGAKQGVEMIVEAARALVDHRRLLFVISGEGVTADTLRARAQGIGNIRFLPLQPAERLNELLNIADIHLLPQQPSASGSVMPSKLIHMLASGRPVVAAARAGTEIAQLVNECGIVVEPDNEKALVSAILNLAEDHAERLRLGERARQRALEQFRQDSIFSDFERELHRRIPPVLRRTADGLPPG